MRGLIMAASRPFWQQCVRGLIRSHTAALKSRATPPSEQLVIADCSEGNICRRSLASGAARSYVKYRDERRHCNAAASGGTSTSRAKSWNSMVCESSYSRPPGNLVTAMRFSTIRFEEENPDPTHTFSMENVTPTGTGLQEVVPEFEEIRSTPLVHAIKSEGSAFTVESYSSEPPKVDSENFSGNLGAIPTSNGSGRQVQPGCVYVGGLPFSVKGDTLRDGLRELCSKFGTVTDVHLAQHRNQSQASIFAGKHRGFAFVTMENEEQAQGVVENLNGTAAWGRIIMVSYGLKRIDPEADTQGPLSKNAPFLERKKVFVGNLNESTSQEDLKNRFQEYGPIEDVKLITELHTGRSRGFAFVMFGEEVHAMRSILDLDGSILDGSVIRVNIAKYPQAY